ncbi:hypothetical protein PVK06_024144 [Gossypium arboreum]|uniref:Serine/threonine-protein phosphatase 7 long form homolog n=1 Tax=Gossypium arboreum TaxID=29729 RepID=A0ABR0PDE1_GOSAR|nr:hypothetical protein PVK06_024144 [Gossypium arboreum]
MHPIGRIFLQTAEDRVLETYINNLSEGALDIIYGHLRDAGFLYVGRMLGGTKLDPPLINVLVERWKPEKHTFHLSCGMLSTTIFMPPSGPPYGFPLVIWWNNPARHIGIPIELEDIRLAIDQQTEEEMPYTDSRIQECVLAELFANLNI